MKTINFILLILVLFILSCNKEKIDDNKDQDGLAALSEESLYLKSGQQVYSDENQNEYLTVLFDNNTLSHIYGIYMEKNKRYNISISGPDGYSMDFNLLKSNKDTLFKGEYVMEYPPRKYITWTSNVSDTFYISIKYIGDINFHTYEYHLTFEELTTKELMLGNINFLCSGDWFINDRGYLALICHQTSVTKWAKIQNDSLYNYKFSYDVGQASGRPDNYIGIDCYASKDIFDMYNIPSSGYVFDVMGPASWRISYWYAGTGGGVGFEYGNFAQNIELGKGSWHNISLTTFGDSIACSGNNEVVKTFRNLSFMDNGLYLTVEDKKQDTIVFRNITLEK